MSGHDEEPRIWARRDRGVSVPQRVLGRQMRANPTDAEKKLWWRLRHRLTTPGTHFRRQVRIGRYIADFACHATRLIVEVDGGQHATQTQADLDRTRALEAHGYRVLGYWNNDVVANIDGGLKDIQRAITATPTPIPSPQGGGESSASRA
jgi:very-short-patch-repair endonuclease